MNTFMQRTFKFLGVILAGLRAAVNPSTNDSFILAQSATPTNVVSSYASSSSSSSSVSQTYPAFVHTDTATSFETISWYNPNFPKYSNIECISIPNGSIINFAKCNVIETDDGFDSISNPHEIVHSAIVVYANVRDLLNKINSSMETEDHALYEYPRLGREMFYSISYVYPFAMTDATNRKNGIFCVDTACEAFPYVRIRPLGLAVTNYKGRIFFSALDKKIDDDLLLSTVFYTMGTSFEEERIHFSRNKAQECNKNFN